MPPPDLSIVLNVHDEAEYLPRTLRSVDEAAGHAHAQGALIELVVVLDRATPEVRELIEHRLVDHRPAGAFVDVRAVTVDHGSLGPSRTAGIEAGRGDHAVLCDADDLASANAFTVALDTARREGPIAVVVPEYLFGFDQNHDVCRYSGSDEVTALRFVTLHPFTSNILARRELLLARPFADVRLGPGYAFEDWHRNCELLADGARFVVAPGTILFHRRRPASLGSTASSVSTRQIPPSRLFDPEVFVRLTSAAVERFAEAGAGWIDLASAAADAEFLDTGPCREIVDAAGAIDPSIAVERYAGSHWQATRTYPVHPGVAYHRACVAVGAGAHFSDVVFAAADTSPHDIDRVLARSGEPGHPASTLLVLAETPAELGPWTDRRDALPSGSALLDMASLHPQLSPDEAEVVCLKLVQATAAGARVHLDRSDLGRRFWARLGSVLDATLVAAPVVTGPQHAAPELAGGGLARRLVRRRRRR